MAKKNQEAAPAEVAATAPVTAAPAAEAPAAPSAVGVRGLKGVPVSALITLIAEKNPKRPGCGAEKRFALYQTGKSVEQFLTEGGTTPDLAYDTAHGFISVEGYTPPKTFTPKERKPKAEKVAKEPKEKKVKVPKDTSAAKAVEEMVVEELVD